MSKFHSPRAYSPHDRKHRISLPILITAVLTSTTIPLAALAKPFPDPPAVPPRLALVESYTFKVSMTTFQKARNARVHADILDWSSDKCSKSPDKPSGFNFVPSCERHDFGYRNYKRLGLFNEDLRHRIDDNLKRDLYKYCSQFSGWSSWRGVECRRIADIYYDAIRACGAQDSPCPQD